MKLPLDELMPSSVGERWWIAVRTATVCRERMPIESSLSYPVPGRGSFRLFHMLPPAADVGSIRILSSISAAVPDARILEFRTSTEGSLFSGLPNEFVGRAQKYDPSIEAALFDVLPQLIDGYLEERYRALGHQFREALDLVAGPDLMPYYRSLNSEFFDWLS
jgi:hypothetical protein